ncbi:MAG: hypothetical protein R6T78_04590 [Dehalococcoidales bacterium]
MSQKIFDDSGRPKPGYGGGVYHNHNTGSSDAARRFETAEKKLRDVIVRVEDYGQLFGDESGQDFPVGAGEWLGFTQVDVSTLYFRNSGSGENGTVHIIGVED